MKKLLLFFTIILWNFSLAQEDCITAIPLCDKSDIAYTPTGGIGEIEEELGGCLNGDEHHTVWYTFTIATAGTLTFTITPDLQTFLNILDYDWAMYGPNKQCSNLGTPIRCSYSDPSAYGGSFLTGLNMTATDTSEGNGGDGFVKYLDVLPGETYYLVLDQYSGTGEGFVLTWGGTSTFFSPFTNLTSPFVPPAPIKLCTIPTLFDFSTLSAGILNGNTGMNVTYHTTQSDSLSGANPITTPINVSGGETYYYRITSSTSTSACFEYGTITFVDGSVTTTPATLSKCEENQSGTATFDLTSANVIGTTSFAYTKKYYPTFADANAGTNEILNPSTYVSGPGEVYVKVTRTDSGCISIAKITLLLSAKISLNTVLEQFVCDDDLDGVKSVDLTTFNNLYTADPGVTISYYDSQSNAYNSANPILPNVIISNFRTFYLRFEKAGVCVNYAILKVTIKTPKKSDILKDQIICINDLTTLDAGAGYTAYAWNTGATTQSISNVSPGSYWVDLTYTNGCVYRQTVKVTTPEDPIIKEILIENNNITINVTGGKPPYQYSLNNITWQTSNVFYAVPRGLNTIYVKDEYDCVPVSQEFTMVNLINIITPNGDGVNDAIDYSALAYKENLTFSIYDRYGTKLFTGDSKNNYKWDGRFFGKQIQTGTYWYSITWTEPDGKNTQVKYSGWILVKNRE